MDANARPAWGRLDSAQPVMLAVATHPDRFTLSVTGDDEYTVPAGEIVRVERGTETSRNRRALRIEHTAAGVYSPVTLFLRWDDPIRHAIEGLRPDLLTAVPRSQWWRNGVVAAFAVGLVLVILGIVLAL